MNNPYQPTDPTKASQAATSLSAFPSLEDTQAALMAAIESVGQRVSAIDSTAAPPVAFSWRHTESRTGCTPPYERSAGKGILMPSYISEVPIAEHNWPQAIGIAKPAAATLGATNTTVFKDEPNNHDVQFSSDTGTMFRFGSQAAAVITGGTGCRLPADKH